MEERENRKPSFMTNALVLVVAQMVMKLLGFIYKLVITNIPQYGDSGNGYYSAGFQIYMIAIAITSMGIPGAISKIVSEKKSIGDYNGAHRIFKIALILFAIVGAIGTVVLFAGSTYIANVILDNPGVEYIIRGLSPALFFVCVSAVIRGYFNGMQDMKATAKSEVIAQFVNCVLTVVIVLALTSKTTITMAAGSALATTFSTIAGFVYLCYFYNKTKKILWKNEIETNKPNCIEQKSIKDIIKLILSLSIPISLGSVITSINRTVDAATVTRGLKAAMGYTDEIANYWYGILSGKIDALTNFPLALNIGFSVVLIPAIASALAMNDKENASKRISISMLFTLLITLPCTVGMMCIADPILHLLYPNAYEGAGLLQIAALTIVFSALSQTMNGALQGMGKVMVPAISLACGCTVKVILNLVLIYNPNINIYGAAIGSVACHIVAAMISFIVLSKNINLHLSWKKHLFKPLISAITMGIITWISFIFFKSILGIRLATLIALGIAVIVYISMVIGLRNLDKEDFEMIPGGQKVLKILEKIKIY